MKERSSFLVPLIFSLLYALSHHSLMLSPCYRNAQYFPKSENIRRETEIYSATLETTWETSTFCIAIVLSLRAYRLERKTSCPHATKFHQVFLHVTLAHDQKSKCAVRRGYSELPIFSSRQCVNLRLNNGGCVCVAENERV